MRPELRQIRIRTKKQFDFVISRCAHLKTTREFNDEPGATYLRRNVHSRAAVGADYSLASPSIYQRFGKHYGVTRGKSRGEHVGVNIGVNNRAD